MSREKVEKRVIFHGNAVALAAHIRRPEDFLIPAVASCCLPATGGAAEADSPGRDFGIISYESASTRARGDYENLEKAAELTRGNHGENDLSSLTAVECTVKGLKIYSELADTAKRRTLVADHLQIYTESHSNRKGPTEFRTLSAAINGVSVDGHLLNVNLDTELFSRHETKEKLCRTYEQSRQFRKRYGKHFLPTEESSDSGCLGWLFGAKTKIPEGKGQILATIVSTLKWADKPAAGTELKGHRLIVDGLGSIYFGEIIIEEDFRRLTLVRFQLGSPTGGEGSACETQSDTHGWPPKTG